MGERVTAGPWSVHIDKPTGWPRVAGPVKANGKRDVVCSFPPISIEKDANAKLIVAAVNACFSINPEHPERVAAEIGHMVERLEELIRIPDAAARRRAEELLARLQNKESHDGK